jgi:hypothetical protein
VRGCIVGAGRAEVFDVKEAEEEVVAAVEEEEEPV